MSSYSVLGDDVLFGGKKKTKFGKTILGKLLVRNPVVQAAKFVVHPIKQTKAALKTISRFDPTAKTAKYGNITKGALMVGAAAGLMAVTGGVAAAPIASKIALAGLKKGITPVRRPPKTIAPPLEQNVATGETAPSGDALYRAEPINSFTDNTGAIPSGSADAAAYDTSLPSVKAGSSSIMLLGIMAVIGVGIYLSKKKMA